MAIVLVSILIFSMTLGAAVLGLHIHKRLPEEQKSDSARSVVGQVSGLVSLLLALVLGTLVGASFGYFGAQKTELESLSAQFLELDRALAHYGPETKPARDQLKQRVQRAYDVFWGGGEVDPKLLTVADTLATSDATEAFLASLNPTTEAQKQALASATTLTAQIGNARILANMQLTSHPVSPGLIVVIVTWAVILFLGMGLLARSNELVISALTLGALCVAFAIFLILELGLPYTGLLRVSPAALQTAIANIDR
jgi:hypothetical protein